MIPEDIDEAVLAAAVKASMRAHTLKIEKVLVSAPAGATAPESALDNLAEDDLPDDDDDEDGAPKRPVLRKPAASGMQRKPAAAEPLAVSTDAVTPLPHAERFHFAKAPLADGTGSGGEQGEEEAKTSDPSMEASASEEPPLDAPQWTVTEQAYGKGGRNYKIYSAGSDSEMQGIWSDP